MAEDRRQNPYPYPTLDEIMAAPGTREEKAARFIVTRHMGGIPCRAFLLGDNDHSIVMRGVRDLTTAVYVLLEALDSGSGERIGHAGTALVGLLENPVMHDVPAVEAE